MDKKYIISAVVGAVVIAGAGFYAGDTYAKSSTPARSAFAAGQFAGRMGGMGIGTRGAGGFTAGEIISKDATSITIKMQDGSTKIVLVGASTQIMKAASGTAADLVSGTQVVVTGSVNSDGSLTAQSVQIRPAVAK